MRDVYIGTGAYLGRVTSETQCAFWPADPRDFEFDPAKLVEVDLARTNEALATGQITGPIHVEAIKTTLGPRWPRGPQFVGRVYLHEAYFSALPAGVRPPNPPTGTSARDYEFWLIVYRPGTADPRAGRRYQGLHAEVVGRVGSRLELDVLEPGRSLAFDAERKRVVIDVASLDACDPPSVSMPAIGTDPAVVAGPIFLAEGRAFEIFRSSPKLPAYMGI